MSKVIINIGFTGTGKTIETKNIIKALDMPLFIYDVNNEYTEFKGSQVGMDFKKFLSEASKKINTCIVFEEATIFFKHQGTSEHMMNLMVRKRHTGNFIICNFHSLRKVPLDILDFASYLIIRKTNDNPETIRKKFEDYKEIFESFEHIECSQDFYEKQYVKLK